MFCQQCGHEAGGGHRFCVQCGHPLGSEPLASSAQTVSSEQTNDSEEAGNKLSLGGKIALWFVILAGLGGLVRWAIETFDLAG